MSYTYTTLPLIEPASADPVVRRHGTHGVVYTKPWIVDLMLDLAGYTSDLDLAKLVIVEPAAGDGNFLGPIVERLIQSCRLHGQTIHEATGALIAFELDADSAERSRTFVRSVLRRHGIDTGTASHLATSWVRTGDYLLATPGFMADIVIGNPPYIRLEEMDATVAAIYRKRYRTMIGRADLYIAFFEAALKQLKPNGVCAYICADRWMLNQYGAQLRRMIAESFAVETIVELHRVDAFESEVSAYPAITVIRRGHQATAVVARAEGGVERLASEEIRTVLESARRSTRTAHQSAELTAARVEGWFEGAAPWPCYSPERLALLKRLEAEMYSLESTGTGTKVSIGVATGADDVFITTDTEVVETGRLLPLAMASDTTGGQLDWSGRYLINPWNERGLVDLARYPQLKAYVEAHEQRLRGRHVGKKSIHGWYRTIDRVDHALTGKAKLYVADIKDRLNPVLDRGETYPHHNLYYVQSAAWDHEVLGGLLLSDVAQFFVECYAVRMRGGYLRFQAQYLRRIRIPRPQDVSRADAEALRAAFRERDRAKATEIALRLYGIDALPGEPH